MESEYCRDCQACALACSLKHEGECNPGLARLRISRNVERYGFSINICRQCEWHDCARVCPVGAIHIDDRGAVVLSREECIGCGACREACAFGAVFYHEGRDVYLICDLCAHSKDGPLCVAICPVGALSLPRDEG
ncbi:MAG: 4Fe-4S dicluster domain-containing protein [Chloroflexota bacterium]